MIRSLELSMLNIRRDFREVAPFCAQYGIQAVGAPAALFEDEKTRVELNAIRKEYGLEWGLLPMPADFYFWDLSDEAFRDALAELERRAVIAEQVGVRFAYNHVWPSGSRPFDENFAWHVDRVRRVAAVLRDHGVRYGLEFLGPHELRSYAEHPFVHSLAGVAAIGDAAGCDVGIVFDSYHWYCSHNGDMGELLWMTEHTDRLVAFHMNDAVPGRDYTQQKDMERRLPLETGIIDTRDLLARFRAKDPDALYMIEPFQPAWDRFAAMTAEEAVRETAALFDRVEQPK